MANYFLTVVNLFCDLMVLAITIKVLLSWFRHGHNRLTYFINDVTRPVLELAQKITPRTGMVDFSPLIAILAIELLRTVVTIIL